MRILITMLLCLSGQAALGAPLVVRSGDHVDFTRIVIEARNNRGWSVQQNSRRVEISPANNIDGYDISRIYDRISRDRVANAAISQNTLILQLACDCSVKSTELQDGLVILDISENEGDLNSASLEDVTDYNNWEDSLLNLNNIFNLQQPMEIHFETSASEALEPYIDDDIFGNLEDRSFLDFDLFDKIDADDDAAGKTAQREDLLSDSRENAVSALEVLQLNLLEQRLAEQIGSATTRGILSPSSQRNRQSENFTSFSDLENNENLGLLTDQDQSDNKSTMANSQRDDTITLNENSSRRFNCDDASSLDIHRWGGTENFQEEVAKHRNNLFGELDLLNKSTQIELAKTYAYYGFGAEALSILSLDTEVSTQNNLLKAISEIISGTSVEHFFEGLESCDSDIAIWAVLADDSRLFESQPNSKAILNSLGKLPIHLRQKFAPRLSRIFRQTGDLQAAELAIRLLKRNAAAVKSNARLESVSTSISTGTTKDIVTELDSLATGNTLEAPLALIKFIDVSVLEGNEISEETVQLAAAYSQEHSGTEYAEELDRAYVLALAKNGQFDSALMEIKSISEEVLLPALDSVFQLLTSEADDIHFLRHAIEIDNENKNRLKIDTARGIAERLLGLGFPEEAIKYTENMQKITPSPNAELFGTSAYGQALDQGTNILNTVDSENTEFTNAFQLVEDWRQENEAGNTIFIDEAPSVSESLTDINEVNATNARAQNGLFETGETTISTETVSLERASQILSETEELSTEVSQLIEGTSLEDITE